MPKVETGGGIKIVQDFLCKDLYTKPGFLFL